MAGGLWMLLDDMTVDAESAACSDSRDLLSLLNRTAKNDPEFSELQHRILQHLAASPDDAGSRSLRAALASKLW